MKLPEHNRLMQTVPDCTHTVKDVIEKIVCLVTGEKCNAIISGFTVFIICTGKGKADEQKIELAERGRLSGDLWKISSSELKVAEERLSHLQIPAHLDVKFTHVFSHPSRLKSHDWKQVC